MALIALLVWTIAVWASRIRNVLTDDDLTAFDQSWRIGVAVVFLGLAGAVIAKQRWALPTLLVWTVVFWLARGIGILVDDHDAAFKLIHSVLALVSFGLVAWVASSRYGSARHRRPQAVT